MDKLVNKLIKDLINCKLVILLLLSNLPVRHWKTYTKGPSQYEVLTYSQRKLEEKRT